MKKSLLGGILGLALVFALVMFASCGGGPGADSIAISAADRLELNQIARDLERSLLKYGKLTYETPLENWEQDDAAYTLEINTAERDSFSFPYLSNYIYGGNIISGEFEWDGDGNTDLKRDGSDVKWEKKSAGKTATFTFTYADVIKETKTFKGTLTINTVYDLSTVGVNALNGFFENVLANSSKKVTITTVKAISAWGQTDAAYTIDATINDSDYIRVFTPLNAPLVNINNYWAKKATIEWKPPIFSANLTASIGNQSQYGSFWIPGGGVQANNYSYVSYDLSTTNAAAQKAEFAFRITYGQQDQVLSGTVTVNVTYVKKTQAELDEDYFESLVNIFHYNFKPNESNLSYNGGVVSCYIDKDIEAWGQTDVVYTISVRGEYTTLSEWDPDAGDSGDWVTNTYPYAIVNLPYPNVVWAGAGVANTVELSGNILKVYQNKTGSADFTFTYTYSPGGGVPARVVKGTVKVTVVK